MIKRNQGRENWADFAKKIETKTGFSKDKTSWSRYAANPPKVKTTVEIIFHLLVFENPKLFDFSIDEKEDNQSDKEPTPTSEEKKNYIPLLIFILIVLTLLTCKLCSYNNSTDIGWTEEFNDNSPKGLKLAGWDFIDFDSAYWNQMRDSSLTLFTQFGEYSGYPPDSTVHNMVIKELACKCCEITVQIIDFNPYSRFQQAGFFLLDKEKGRDKTFRHTVMTMGTDTVPDIRICRHNVFNTRATQVFIYDEGRVHHSTHKIAPDQIYDLKVKPKAIKNIFLRTKFHRNSYESSYNLLNKKTNFEKIVKDSFYFEPFYIGLACLGSGVKAKPFPASDDDIPAYFKFVEVKSCD